MKKQINRIAPVIGETNTAVTNIAQVAITISIAWFNLIIVQPELKKALL